jgi:hypothetical protein
VTAFTRRGGRAALLVVVPVNALDYSQTRCADVALARSGSDERRASGRDEGRLLPSRAGH